ncbi:MAG TPA: L-fucose:H+ symporter permease [Puia sp.]|nr:L-fucose:H+ symporter permease [Puia sp.]
MSKNKYLLPFILICTLFFMWAFLHNINGILIPHLKKVCHLTDTQSSLIDLAVYLAYFVIAIPAGLFSHRFGYKKGILFGLFLYAAGALVFLPAADSRSFILFLLALFIAASGAAFLETMANPYATILGSPATSEQRLNFAQSFNGLGAVAAPFIGTHFILSGVEHSQAELDAMAAKGQLEAYLNQEAGSLKPIYFIIAIILVLLAIIFIFTRLPEVTETTAEGHIATKFSLGVFRISHVRWAAIGEFFYVGAQAGILSFFIRFARYTAGIPEKEAGDLQTYAMIGFMAGRFLGTYFMRFVKPAQLLSLYAVINIGLVLIALTTHGRIAVYTLMLTPFFMSIMFPTIFALGIKDLGEETKLASSFLVMAIIGGAFTPLMMGLISDKTGSIQIAYIMPMICFAFILYFGLKGHKVKPDPKPQPALA